MLRIFILSATLLFGAAAASHRHGAAPAPQSASERNAGAGRRAESWPQFRGPHGAGLAAPDCKPPTEWSETKNIRWKTAIHDRGWSSPVVWGDQIWLTTALPDGKQMFVLCVDRNTGKILLDRKLWDIEKPAFINPMNSYASPTCAAEEGRVYVSFGSYGTVGLDTRTFEQLWERRDLPCDHFRGPASSPILWNDRLFLHFDGFDFQYVVALDKATGKTLWRTDRNLDFGTADGDFKKAFGTPRLIEAEGRNELICPAAVWTQALDPMTGKELWRVKHGGINVAAPPLFGHGLLFLSTGWSGDRLLAVRPGGSGDVTAERVVWRNKQGAPTRSSPLLADDLIYMVSDKGVACAVEASTGKTVWQERIGGDFSASPIFAGGHLYFAPHEGPITVLKAGRKFEKVAANKLAEGCMATPAAVDDCLYVRTTTDLYCIGAR